MRHAIELAREAASMEEVPIGCIVVDDLTGEVIGRVALASKDELRHVTDDDRFDPPPATRPGRRT